LLKDQKLLESSLYIPNGFSHYVICLFQKQKLDIAKAGIHEITVALKCAIDWVKEGQSFKKAAEAMYK